MQSHFQGKGAPFKNFVDRAGTTSRLIQSAGTKRVTLVSKSENRWNR